ncbi:MAG: hypothetical protein M3121_01905 [Chloroflexota bacterium]|nr:hypothetical protein [Chloroflexota bacterium]
MQLDSLAVRLQLHVDDPNATVAWSGPLTPEITTDISMRTLLGRGSEESIQLKFEGSGWVVMQPYEEVQLAQGK